MFYEKVLNTDDSTAAFARFILTLKESLALNFS
jgi:hypothetical protein